MWLATRLEAEKLGSQTCLERVELRHGIFSKTHHCSNGRSTCATSMTLINYVTRDREVIIYRIVISLFFN